MIANTLDLVTLAHDDLKYLVKHAEALREHVGPPELVRSFLKAARKGRGFDDGLSVRWTDDDAKDAPKWNAVQYRGPLRAKMPMMQ